MAQPVYKINSIFFLVGCGGDFWEVIVGVHRPALLIFTLFQSNIYKVNVREYPPGGNSMMAWHELLTHVKRRQPLNEVVFEASVLRVFIVSFKRFYDEYLLGFFFTIFWSLRLWMIFSLPKRDCKSLSVFVARKCVYIHPLQGGGAPDKLNKDVSQAIICTLRQFHFQKMVGWVAFKFPLYVEV